MQLVASRTLKIAYAIALLAAVSPLGLASSGWAALAMGGGTGIIFGVLLFLFGIYRVISVFTNPQSLIAYPAKGTARALRVIGVFALYAGAAIGILNLLSRPLMAMFITQRTESGVEFFVVGMVLAMLGSVGVLGLLSFEMSRLLSLEEHARSQMSRQISHLN